jgi:ComF family protein
MGDSLRDPRLSGRSFDAIVPVPLHPLRERERGFNQAGLLAAELGRSAGLPLTGLLRRTRDTGHQARFDRAGRLENLEGAFRTRRRVRKDARLLLVDDVCTTGITLDVCARVLLEAGAAEVCAVTVARG